MKKLLSFFFTLLILITLQSTAFAQDQSEVSTEKIDTSAWVTYKIKELGMSIKLPPDMKVYTRESIKKGNVEEDEKLANVISNFEDKDLIFEAISTEMDFNLYVFGFYNSASIIWPNLFSASDDTFNNFIKKYNIATKKDIYFKFVTPNGNFIKSTVLNTKNEISRIFYDYDTHINFQLALISFSSNRSEVPSYNQKTYDHIVHTIQFNNYRFNFIFLIFILSLCIIVTILCLHLIKKKKIS